MKGICRLLMLAGLLFMPACHQIYWTKPGFNAVDWQRDNYECERDSRMSVLSFGRGIGGALNEQGFFNRCLVAHGYYQVQGTPSPPASVTLGSAIGETDEQHDARCRTACRTSFGADADCDAMCESQR
jgi:hypothetical protein